MITTSTSTRSVIAILANHLELQTRMQKEIDHVLGETEPRLQDKDQLHYVNAVHTAFCFVCSLVLMENGNTKFAA